MATAPRTPTADNEDIFTDNYKKFQERRATFENIDNDINASAARMMKAMADLAERQPEAFFGLKPSDREVFVLNKVFDPDVLKAMSAAGGTADLADGQDIIGGQTAPAPSGGGLLGGLKDLLGEVLKKVDIGKLITDLIAQEKKYWGGQSKEDGDKAKQEKDKKTGTQGK